MSVEEEVEMENEDGTYKDAESKEELVEALKRMAEILGVGITAKDPSATSKEKYCPNCGELESECGCDDMEEETKKPKKSIVIAFGNAKGK